jgi:uncharacterized protein involved in exopolysaccharide biosynthesis
MSLGTLFLIVWKRRLAFVLAFLLISGGFSVTPMFESEAFLMISEDRSHQSRFPDALRYEINSEIYVIARDGVLRQAIESIGPQNLLPDRGRLSGADGPVLRLVGWFKDWALSSVSATDGSPIELALLSGGFRCGRTRLEGCAAQISLRRPEASGAIPNPCCRRISPTAR